MATLRRSVLAPAASRGTPLRILFVIPVNVDSPSVYHIRWFAEGLERLGHRSLVALFGDPRLAEVENVRPSAGIDYLWYRHRGRGLCKDSLVRAVAFKPTLIHVWTARVPAIAAARAFRGATGAPVCVHWEDDEWALREGAPGRPVHRVVGSRIRRLVALAYPPAGVTFTNPASLRWVAEHATALDALTPALSHEITARLGRACSVTLPATPDAAAHPGEAQIDLPIDTHERAIVAYTGTVGPESIADMRVALQAVAQLQRRDRRVALVHTGASLPRYDLGELARASGVTTGTVAFLGRVPFEQMLALLARADIVIQPGAPTQFNRLRLPSKLQAYLASGTPTITFASGFGETLEDRCEVLKLYNGSAEELAERIEDVLDDPALRAALSAGARRASRRLFDQATNTEHLIQFYRGSLKLAF